MGDFGNFILMDTKNHHALPASFYLFIKDGIISLFTKIYMLSSYKTSFIPVHLGR